MNLSPSTVVADAIYADTPDGVPVAIDFHQIIGEHTLVAAQTGQGKSVLLRKIEELALAAGHVEPAERGSQRHPGRRW